MLFLKHWRLVLVQIVGFALLIFGMFVYNELVFGPLFRNRFMPWMASVGCRLSLFESCCTPEVCESEAKPSSNNQMYPSTAPGLLEEERY